MPQPTLDLRTKKRVDAYLEADIRYSVAPIPTPVEPATAAAVITPLILRTSDLEHLSRAARLAIFHDLTATAGSWARMLGGGEADADAVGKTAWSIAALAWLGDAEQRARAATAFNELLLRADPERSHAELLEAALALGTTAHRDSLRSCIERRASQLQAESKRPEPGRPPEAAAHLSIRADQLLQLVRVQLPRWQRSIDVRNRTVALAPTQRAPKLAALYCETDPESDTPLVWWSACALVRLPFTTDKDGRRQPDGDLRTAIAAAFMAIADAHDKKDPDDQEEIDMTRQRALHAAVFFSGVPTEQEREWLYTRPERGVDLLVLRPDFVYPAPHSHNTPAVPPPPTPRR